MWMTKVSINIPVFATMVMAALMVLGLFSYKRLAVDQLPDLGSIEVPNRKNSPIDGYFKAKSRGSARGC